MANSIVKREADFGRLFRHWIQQNRMHSAAFELKQTTSNRLPFSSVKEHQLNALLAVKKQSLLYKIPDDSRGIKPFDMVYLHQADAFVVIRYPDKFVLIDVEKFIDEMEWSQEKSLTSERAAEIAKCVVSL